MKARVKNGQLLTRSAELKDLLAKFEGKDVEFTIKKWVKSKSWAQMKFFHHVLVKEAIEMFKEQEGQIFTPDVMKGILKHGFWYEEVQPPGKKPPFRIQKSLKKATIEEASGVITNIIQWMATRDWIIQDPTYYGFEDWRQ